MRPSTEGCQTPMKNFLVYLSHFARSDTGAPTGLPLKPFGYMAVPPR